MPSRHRLLPTALPLACAALAALVAFPAAASPAPAPAVVLGQTGTGTVSVDGVAVPAGTTLVSPSRISTGAEPALLHLPHGRLIALGAGSEARLEQTDGGIRLEVSAGQAAVRRGAEVLLVAAAETMVFAAPLPTDDEATSDGETVELCTYDVEEGRWELITVDASEADARLEAGDVYPGKANNELGLDDECAHDGVVVWTTGTKVATGVGLAALTALIIEDDDSSEASP